MTVSKFSHAVMSGFLIAAIVVIAICAWYLLRKRDIEFSLKSIKYAAVFGIASFILLFISGDNAGYVVAKTQPMKLAAMEGLYEGQEGTPIVGVALLNPKKTFDNQEKPYLFDISVPYGLSLLANRSCKSFVPGISDIIKGGYKYKDINGDEQIALSFEEKVERGQMARRALNVFAAFKDKQDNPSVKEALAEAKVYLDENFKYFGYGFLTDFAVKLTKI